MSTHTEDPGTPMTYSFEQIVETHKLTNTVLFLYLWGSDDVTIGQHWHAMYRDLGSQEIYYLFQDEEPVAFPTQEPGITFLTQFRDYLITQAHCEVSGRIEVHEMINDHPSRPQREEAEPDVKEDNSMSGYRHLITTDVLETPMMAMLLRNADRKLSSVIEQHQEELLALEIEAARILLSEEFIPIIYGVLEQRKEKRHRKILIQCCMEHPAFFTKEPDAYACIAQNGSPGQITAEHCVYHHVYAWLQDELEYMFEQWYEQHKGEPVKEK